MGYTYKHTIGPQQSYSPHLHYTKAEQLSLARASSEDTELEGQATTAIILPHISWGIPNFIFIQQPSQVGLGHE